MCFVLMDNYLIVIAALLLLFLLVSEYLGLTSDPEVNSIFQLLLSLFKKELDGSRIVVLAPQQDIPLETISQK